MMPRAKHVGATMRFVPKPIASLLQGNRVQVPRIHVTSPNMKVLILTAYAISGFHHGSIGITSPEPRSAHPPNFFEKFPIERNLAGRKKRAGWLYAGTADTQLSSFACFCSEICRDASLLGRFKVTSVQEGCDPRGRCLDHHVLPIPCELWQCDVDHGNRNTAALETQPPPIHLGQGFMKCLSACPSQLANLSASRLRIFWCRLLRMPWMTSAPISILIREGDPDYGKRFPMPTRHILAGPSIQKL
jgi:hypothetical protein